MLGIFIICGTIAIVVIAIGAGWYFSGQITREAREIREAEEAEPQQIDSWRGFSEAHQNHPPVFTENDSWKTPIS